MFNVIVEEIFFYLIIRYLKYGGYRLEDIILFFICKLVLFNISSWCLLNIFLNILFSNLYIEFF